MPLRQGAGAGAGISPEFVPGGTPLRPSPRPAPLSNRVDSPHPPLRRGIPIRPSPAAPPRPRFTPVAYPYASPATPTPPALRAPPPPLPRGGGSACDIRGKPYPVLPRGLPWEWIVVAIASGGGDRGGGSHGDSWWEAVPRECKLTGRAKQIDTLLRW